MSHAMQKTAHEVTSDIGGYILGGLEFVGGAALALGGLATGNPLLVAAGVGVAGEGVSTAEKQAAANKQEAQTVANVGDFSAPPTVPTTAGGGSSAGPAVQQTTEAGIAAERYAEAQTSIGSMQAQLDQTVLNEKVAEIQAEGGITASAAARGLKMEGSPMMQLLAQQQAGATTVGYTQQQGTAAITGQRTGAQASFDAAALAGKEQLQYADEQMSNAWLSSFTDVLNTSAGMVSKFWNPTSAAAETAGSDNFFAGSSDPYLMGEG
jgi:hypothetical protein